MRFASAAFPVANRDRFWQAFCLAKQAPIRYTAGWIGECKLRGNAARLIRHAIDGITATPDG
jgi:hypothetical protein